MMDGAAGGMGLMMGGMWLFWIAVIVLAVAGAIWLFRRRP